jgi:hypothetical protein
MLTTTKALLEVFNLATLLGSGAAALDAAAVQVSSIGLEFFIPGGGGINQTPAFLQESFN